MSIALPAVLVNSVNVQTASGSMRMRSGRTITDPITQAAVLAGGGQLAPTTDPNIVAAAAIVLKLRGRGADEATCDLVMVAAAAIGTDDELLINTQISLTAAASTVLPAPVGKAGVFGSAGLSLIPPVTGGAGESAVYQLKKNGSNVAGATATLNATTLAGVAVPIPATAGLAYLATDTFTLANTYTAGAGAYAGLSADLVGQGG
jgi:hypothetical protein